MIPPRTYPRLTTNYPPDMHPTVEIQYEEGGSALVVCGSTWCDGRCGLPAAVVPAGDGISHEQKVYSSMTAVGPVLQGFRVKWTGAKVEVPEPYRAALAKKYWM